MFKFFTTKNWYPWSIAGSFLILISTYMILDFISLIGYAILANKLIMWIKANPRVINSISACVLIIIAIIIAITQQY